MNIDYLYSIINLYLKREKDTSRTNMVISKKEDNLEFNVNMQENDPNKTIFVFPYDIFAENMDNILSLYKDNILVIKEDYKYNKDSDTCKYTVEFKNGRKISFKGFSIHDVNKIRNSIYNITIDKEKIRLNINDNLDFDMKYQNNFKYSYAGFTSMKEVLFISVFFFVVLVVSLFLFM